ncbi:hypothetical protein SDC9_20336 [bioreactor metagenome]|uniref:Uncharacterized protein n=1 Tax=bioreactor metagenome TaxID=1076179 RepID=A0A644U6F9_9ZZZZ|nr:hypothetical protein [Methanocorpusculum sp.]
MYVEYSNAGRPVNKHLGTVIMNTAYKILTLLFAAMFLIIPVAAVEDEDICVVTQDPVSLYPHLVHITFTALQELPEHAELSPFFRDDLIETEETDEICDEVTAWFINNEPSAGLDGSVISPDTREDPHQAPA